MAANVKVAYCAQVGRPRCPPSPGHFTKFYEIPRKHFDIRENVEDPIEIGICLIFRAINNVDSVRSQLANSRRTMVHRTVKKQDNEFKYIHTIQRPS